LDNLRARAERLVRQGLANLPVEGGQWRALAVTDAGIYVDGRFALGGIGLAGRNISFSVFGVAGQAGALRALEVLANRLDLEVVNIVAASQALATVTPHSEAIILDTGLSGTDVCLIRNNSLVASGWIPFGGKFFTQSLAQAMEVSLVEAKKLKHGLTNGTLPEDLSDQVDTCLEEPRQRWYQAVMDLLFQLSLQADPQNDVFNKPLPEKIILTGRGNLLPGLDNLLRSDSYPFNRAPEIARLRFHAAIGIKDLTDGLDQNLFSLTVSLISGLPG
jgi:cell division ATPase FtsA